MLKGKEKVHENVAPNKERSRPKETSKWKPPPQWWVKLNTDADFWPDMGWASTGLVIHDHVGKVLLTTWRWLRNCGSPEEAEAEACLQGVRLVSEWIRQPTEVESDCQMLVRRLMSNVQDMSVLGRFSGGDTGGV
jgi:hypothetical protein